MEQINLVKAKAEVMTVNLAKKGLTTIPPLRVVADLDVSGSMNMRGTPFYNDGTVERAFEKLLGLAFKFDDNGEIDVFAFDNSAHELPTAKIADFGHYVTRNITKQWNRYGGGTSYARPLQANMDFLFGEQAAQQAKPAGFLGGMFAKKPVTPAPSAQELPALVLFFTDGDAPDGAEAGRILAAAEASNKPVYFHLIGIGTATTFPVLKKLADDYDNCGFINLHSIDMSDDDLYRALTTDEFVAFLKKHGAA
jgi:hypothetical protein